jgi:hypothetical protein
MLSDLPADVAAAVERGDKGPWHWTVDGEPCPNCWTTIKPKCPCVKGYVPPAVFARLDQPCPTCEGVTYTFGYPEHHGDPYDVQRCDNPDCHDGRLVFTIVKPCDCLCHGVPTRMPTELCYCDGTGSVSVARATLRVLPVISEDRWDEDNPPLPCVVITRTGKAVYMGLRIGEGWGTELPLDPVPSPGQYVARLEVS